MIHNLLIFLEQYVLPFGPAGVFLASFIEEVVAPIPSAVIMLMSGFLFIKGTLSLALLFDVFYLVALPAALGVSVGSLVVYGLARHVGIQVLVRWGKYIGITEAMIEKAQAYFKDSKKDEWLVFIARIIPVVPAVAIALGAGLIRMNVWRYLAISFVGTVIRAYILGIVGWQVGEVYTTYAEIIGRWEKYALIIIIASVVSGILYIKFKNKKLN